MQSGNSSKEKARVSKALREKAKTSKGQKASKEAKEKETSKVVSKASKAKEKANPRGQRTIQVAKDTILCLVNSTIKEKAMVKEDQRAKVASRVNIAVEQIIDRISAGGSMTQPINPGLLQF